MLGILERGGACQRSVARRANPKDFPKFVGPSLFEKGNTIARSGSRVWLTKQSLPITVGEYWPPLKPTNERHQANYSRNQQREIRCFSYEYFTDVHCGVSITKPAAPPLSFPVLVRWIYRAVIGSQRLHDPHNAIAVIVDLFLSHLGKNLI